MCEDADRSMIYTGRGAEQDHTILRIKLRSSLCHGLLSPPAFRKRSHRVLAPADEY
jgi:hypothetical protein